MRADEGQAAARRRVESVGGVGTRQAFGETANPGDYVPRAATEDALLELERLVRAGRTTALTAPPGLGKSLLLRLLARRLAPEFCALFLPYGAVTLEELCAWTLGLLDGPGPDPGPDDPLRALLLEARRRAEQGELLLLLIDDAGSMPVETARELSALVRESGNRIRVVVGTADDAASSRVLAALHNELAEVRFKEPMDLRETQLYVETRLDQAGVPDSERARFGADSIESIHRLSGGVPRRVHDVASRILVQAPEGVGSAWKEERWLGAPIDEAEALLEIEPVDHEPELPELWLDEDEPGVA